VFRDGVVGSRRRRSTWIIGSAAAHLGLPYGGVSRHSGRCRRREKS